MFKITNIFIISLLFHVNYAHALKVGVTSGPHAVIMEEVQKEAIKDGLDIQIVEFNDFISPNAALADKSIDANSYQHQPFLDEQIKARDYKIVPVAKTIILPLGMYSAKYKDLNIKDGAKIAIPNDPTNNGRALLLLEKAKLIELTSKDNPSILEISANPYKLQIIEVEAPQIPRVLEDVDYGITNTDWILLAKIDPNSALIKEDKESKYSNVIAIRAEDKETEDIKKLIAIYHSNNIKNFIIEKFKGAVLPAW